MRRLLAILSVLLAIALPAQAQIIPTIQGLTVNGNVSITGTSSLGAITATGSANFLSGGTLAGTFGGPTTLSNTMPVLTPYTIGTLPASPVIGSVVYVSDCLNGTQTLGFGTGCPYYSNNNNVWTPLPSTPTLAVTVGGQALFLGGSSLNQGNGNRIQLATSGTPGVSGQCAQFDANLNIVPSGGGCGAGGGSGTVSSGLINQLGFYAAGGTTISGLATANNGMLVTSGGGVPSISTTGPSGMTFPAPTISNANLTGTATASAITLTAALTTAASGVGGAFFNLPQGTAPTVPVNGNKWATSAGEFGRFNGVTIGPYIGLAQLAGTAPIVDTSGTFSCPTCLTTGSGGSLAVTAPIVLTSSTLSLGTTIGAAEYFANATNTVTNDTYPLPVDTWPWATGTIDSVTYYTGGSSTPSFGIALQINGVNVTGCNAITVSSSSRTTSTCTAANSITTGQHPTLVITGVAGTPFSSLVQISYHHSNP